MSELEDNPTKTSEKEEIINSEDLLMVYGSNHRAFENIAVSNIHFAFTWKNQHKLWFDSNVPVFIDFGHKFLYWLKKRDQILAPFWYIHVIKKSDFISKYSK